MSESTSPWNSDSSIIHDVVYRFEIACKDGKRPNVGDFLQGEGEMRQQLLLELLQSDLELRLRTGDDIRVLQYIANYTELKLRPEAVISLLKVEVQCLRQLGRQPLMQKYAADYGELLGTRLEEVFHPQTPLGTTIKLGSIIAHKYKLISELGEGGMGTVYLAEQLQPVRRSVALKLIKAGMDSKAVLARFEAERQALALMDHPNIAKMHDGGITEQSHPYFVMELVKGLPLTKFCDQEKLSLKERMQLFITVCQAVQHAHQKGIIHRDLKPSNILVTFSDGEPIPKVIDFGVSKALHQRLSDKTIYTEVGMLVGTLEYMAPEQANLNNLDIDTRADIYALGVILYELLAGIQPFTGKELRNQAYDEMLRIIREVEPLKPSSRITGLVDIQQVAAKRKLIATKLTRMVSGDLDCIAMKCLEKDRQSRYPTASSLADDIGRWISGDPISARNINISLQFWRWIRKNVKSASLVAFLAIFLGVVTGIVFLKKGIGQGNSVGSTNKDGFIVDLYNALQNENFDIPWYISTSWWNRWPLLLFDSNIIAAIAIGLLMGCGGLLITKLVSSNEYRSDILTGASYGLIFGITLFMLATGPTWVVNRTVSPTLVDLHFMTQLAVGDHDETDKAMEHLFRDRPQSSNMSKNEKRGHLFTKFIANMVSGAVTGVWYGVFFTIVLCVILSVYQSSIAGVIWRSGVTFNQALFKYIEMTSSLTLIALIMVRDVASLVGVNGDWSVLYKDENGRNALLMLLVLAGWTILIWIAEYNSWTFRRLLFWLIASTLLVLTIARESALHSMDAGKACVLTFIIVTQGLNLYILLYTCRNMMKSSVFKYAIPILLTAYAASILIFVPLLFSRSDNDINNGIIINLSIVLILTLMLNIPRSYKIK